MVLGILAFLYFSYKAYYTFPIETFSIGYWGGKLRDMATVYEAVEYVKDFIYLDKFPHYSWWTVLILTYALLASVSLGLL